MKKKTKILIVAANPKGTSRLRLDKEVREIEQALHRSPRRAAFALKAIWATHSRDLRRALLDEQPQIVHFSGHSNVDGLFLENHMTGDAVVVPPAALKDLFNLFSDNLECILLNACYSEAQATALATRIPHVIGMKEEIVDDSALEFAVGFYDALSAGRPVEQAFQFGCNAIDLLGRQNNPQPIILARSAISASDLLPNANHIYCFRAECQPDVDKLRSLLGGRFDKITVVNSPPFPDVEVELEIELSLEELRSVMRRVVDGHVMVQTVALRDKYTGERDYDL